MLVCTSKKTVTKRPDNSRYQIYNALILSSKKTLTAKHIMGNFLQQSVLGLSLDLIEGEDWEKLHYYCKVLFFSSCLSLLVI